MKTGSGLSAYPHGNVDCTFLAFLWQYSEFIFTNGYLWSKSGGSQKITKSDYKKVVKIVKVHFYNSYLHIYARIVMYGLRLFIVVL